MENLMEKKVISRITIREIMTLGVIEEELKKILIANQYDIWGEINLTSKEYWIITEKIKKELNGHYENLYRMFFNYKVTMITQLITFLQLEYNNEKVWEDWLNGLGCQEVSIINDIKPFILNTLKEYNYSIDADNGLKYITPLLRQAGIPNVCFGKLFNMLVTDINSKYFNAYDFVSEIIAYKHIYLDAPVSRFFKEYSDKAEEIVEKLLLLIEDDVSEENVKFIAEQYDISERIVHKYVEWKLEDKENLRKNKCMKTFYSPKLTYEYGKGLSLFLPEQIIRNSNIYVVRWEIESYTSGQELVEKITKKADVYEDTRAGISRILERTLAVLPASQYKVILYNDDTDECLFEFKELNLFDEYGMAFFQKENLMTESYISENETIVLCRSYVSVEKSYHCEYTQIDLPEKYKNVSAISVYATEEDAELVFRCFDKIKRITCDKKMLVYLKEKNTLFAQKYSYKEVPVYTELPQLIIKNEVNYENCQILIKSSSRKISKRLTDLIIEKSESYALITLSDELKEIFDSVNGLLEYKLFAGNDRVTLRFYKVPYIEYDLEYFPTQVKKERSGFYIKKPENVEILWENTDVKMLNNVRGKWQEIYTDKPIGKLEGTLVVYENDRKIQVPFYRTIRKYQCKIWNEDTYKEEIGGKIFRSHEFLKDSYSLVINCFEEYSFSGLELRNKENEVLQRVEIKTNTLGEGVVRLGYFKDTVKESRLPLALYLIPTDMYEKEVCIARIIEDSYFPRLKYSEKYKAIYWNYTGELQCDKLKISLYKDINQYFLYDCKDLIKRKLKSGQEVYFLKLPENIAEGLYIVEIDNEIDDIFAMDTFEEIKILEYNQAVYVGDMKKLDFTECSLSSFFDGIIDSLKSVEELKEILNKLPEVYKRKNVSNFDYEFNKVSGGTTAIFDCVGESSSYFEIINKLLIIASNISPKCKLEKEHYTLVYNICEMVNMELLTAYDRYWILKYLLEKHFDEKLVIFFIKTFQLYLFDYKPEMEKIQQKDFVKMWVTDSYLATLMCIKGCVEEFSINRVVSHIGFESLEQMVRFPNVVEDDEWLKNFQAVLTTNEKISCNVINDERVWGDYEEYGKLFSVSDRCRKKEEYLREITETDTNGYVLFGMTYLELLKDIVIGRKQQENYQERYNALEKCYHEKELEFSKVLMKYSYLMKSFSAFLEKRRGGNIIGNITVEVGCFGVLNALSHKYFAISEDIKIFFDFIKNAEEVIKELVYRDLIMSELLILLGE